MAVSVYILPQIGTGTEEDPYRPKYSDTVGIVRTGNLRYGRGDTTLALFQAPTAILATIDVQPDVFKVADATTADDVLTTGQATAAENFLEGLGIPADWIAAGETRRQVMRGVAGMFLISQRMEGRFGENFRQKAARHGVNWNSRWNQLPQALKDELQQIADEYQIATSGITNGTRLRAIFKLLGDSWQAKPITIGGFEV